MDYASGIKPDSEDGKSSKMYISLVTNATRRPEKEYFKERLCEEQMGAYFKET